MTRWAKNMDAGFRRGVRDEGFTLAEVLVSVVILFFALTAIMTLMLGNIQSSSRAAVRTAVVNAGNSYFEQLRAMNYASLASLETTTIAMGGYSVEVEPTVELVDDETMAGTGDYKLVTIQLTGSGAGMSDVVMSMQTIIREDNSGTKKKPTVDFTTGSPADGSVVYGASVQVGATATAEETGAYVTMVNLYAGKPMMSTGGETAQWATTTSPVTKYFYWDTTLWDDGTTRRTKDGTWMIKAEAWDSNQRSAYRDRTVVIDNYAPDVKVSALYATPVNATTMGLRWNTALDGLDRADSYRFSVRRQPSYAVSALSSADWIRMTDLGFTVAGEAGEQQSASGTTAALSRYQFRIRSVSPRGLAGSTPDQTVVAVSRPEMSGTFTNTKAGVYYTGVNTMSVAGPTFLNTSKSAKVLRSMNADMSSATEYAMTWSDSTGKWSYTDTLPATKSGSPKYYYQAVVTVRPDGYEGGSDVVVKSQILTTSSQTASSGTLQLVGW